MYLGCGVDDHKFCKSQQVEWDTFVDVEWRCFLPCPLSRGFCPRSSRPDIRCLKYPFNSQWSSTAQQPKDWDICSALKVTLLRCNINSHWSSLEALCWCKRIEQCSSLCRAMQTTELFFQTFLWSVPIAHVYMAFLLRGETSLSVVNSSFNWVRFCNTAQCSPATVFIKKYSLMPSLILLYDLQSTWEWHLHRLLRCTTGLSSRDYQIIILFLDLTGNWKTVVLAEKGTAFT